MEIDTLLDQVETTYHLDKEEEIHSLWMGRSIRLNMDDRIQFAEELIKEEKNTSIHPQHKKDLQSRMTRACDQSHAEISGGYDDKRGCFIEGKWTWEWNDKSDKESSSQHEGRTREDSPDFSDRDFEKAEKDN